MTDENNADSRNYDNTAKTLAIIGIILAILALGWAMKADKRAGDAESKAETSQSQNTIPTTANDIRNSQVEGTYN